MAADVNVAEWSRTAERLPPDGVPVDTISPGGTAQRLVRRGALWFLEPDGMYVYYIPLLWRYPKERAK